MRKADHFLKYPCHKRNYLRINMRTPHVTTNWRLFYPRRSVLLRVSRSPYYKAIVRSLHWGGDSRRHHHHVSEKSEQNSGLSEGTRIQISKNNEPDMKICICNSSPQKVLRGLLTSGRPYCKTLGIISLKFQSELNVYIINHTTTQAHWAVWVTMSCKKLILAKLSEDYTKIMYYF